MQYNIIEFHSIQGETRHYNTVQQSLEYNTYDAIPRKINQIQFISRLQQKNQNNKVRSIAIKSNTFQYNTIHCDIIFESRKYTNGTIR